MLGMVCACNSWLLQTVLADWRKESYQGELECELLEAKERYTEAGRRMVKILASQRTTVLLSLTFQGWGDTMNTVLKMRRHAERVFFVTSQRGAEMALRASVKAWEDDWRESREQKQRELLMLLQQRQMRVLLRILDGFGVRLLQGLLAEWRSETDTACGLRRVHQEFSQTSAAELRRSQEQQKVVVRRSLAAWADEQRGLVQGSSFLGWRYMVVGAK
jgi:hypothetical protein